MPEKSGFRKGYTLRNFQIPYKNLILEAITPKKYENVFLSLPQGVGKTVIALAALSEMINQNLVRRVLVLLPRRALVDQWVERALEMFYGIGLMKSSAPSRGEVERIKGWMKHSGASGIAITMHSFRSLVKKELLSQEDFDLVIVDEAADSVVSRDFIERFRLSAYFKGFNKWHLPKIFLFPYIVDEKRLRSMINKFGKDKTLLIREKKETEDTKRLNCVVRDPVLIDDPEANWFAVILDEHYRKIRKSVNRLLDKYGIEGYRENLETLLNSLTLERLKKKHSLPDDVIQEILTLISKYVLVQHVKKWILYSNREELSRSILAFQSDVADWLRKEDLKLNKLLEVIKNYLEKDKKVYIFSQYIATAELISDFLSKKLRLKGRDVVLIMGAEENQYEKLECFKKIGKILISTPVFDKGTDIPEADVIIVYTPPYQKDKLLQVIGRIRGGEVVFLSYRGYEEEGVRALVDFLRREVGGEKYGIDRYL